VRLQRRQPVENASVGVGSVVSAMRRGGVRSVFQRLALFGRHHGEWASQYHGARTACGVRIPNQAATGVSKSPLQWLSQT
jgi:hypothetical protein